MKNYILILSFAILLLCCHKVGNCDEVVNVSFRKLNFKFPIKGFEVQTIANITSYNGDQIQTDSIFKRTSASWYMKWYDNAYSSSDTVHYLKDAFVYAVTFRLFGESRRSDKDILQELSKECPGRYQYVDQDGSQYYIHRRNCLTVIFRRDWFDEGAVPIISFCYGLNEQEGNYFGRTTGNTAHHD